MSTSNSGQKFIRRNRAPRVQIEYDVETYGSQKKVQLPFVVGVMADLAGNQVDPPAKLEDRKFLEFDHDNFDSRLRAMKQTSLAAMLGLPATPVGWPEFNEDEASGLTEQYASAEWIEYR